MSEHEHKRRKTDAESAEDAAGVVAAGVVADAAILAAERVAQAAAAAVESAASAASAASSASQIVAAVAVSRLDGLEKNFNRHEVVCAERYKELGHWMKTTFFTMLVAVGAMSFYLMTHGGHQ